jgi:hypothetical protein
MVASMPPNISKMTFSLPIATDDYYLDISQVVSLCNRKFVRQGLNWVVSNIEIISDGDTRTTISKLPTSWVFANAWVKGFDKWREMRDQVLDDNPSIEAKYSDFKVYYDEFHEANGVANNLLPIGYSINHALSDSYEWDMSELSVPNDPAPGAVGTYHIHALGASNPASKALISGYALSRSRPQQVEPNAPAANSWMQQLFDVGDQLPEIREDVVEENASPPYSVGIPTGVDSDEEFYPGGSNQANTWLSFIEDVLQTRAGTALGFDSSGTFIAPCGLLHFDVQLPNPEALPSNIYLLLTLAPGPVKGFLAQPMQEMN